MAIDTLPKEIALMILQMAERQFALIYIMHDFRAYVCPAL
jgi:hypothetical protein